MTHEHHREDCLRLFTRLSEYIDNELDEINCDDIERHMDTCVPCQVCLQTLKRTIEICRQTRPRPVPAEFSQRLKDLIGELPGANRP
jgi:anti-sigma factor RsiW